jgi:hypothetical protein
MLLAGIVGLAVGGAAGAALATSNATTVSTSAIRASPASTRSSPAAGAKAGTGTLPPPAQTTAQARGHAKHRQLSYSGTGPHRLGTITLASSQTFTWASTAAHFTIRYTGGQIVSSSAHAGRIFAPAGRYRQITIDTPSHWTLTSH